MLWPNDLLAQTKHLVTLHAINQEEIVLNKKQPTEWIIN